jgi:hypothetical protein
LEGKDGTGEVRTLLLKKMTVQKKITTEHPLLSHGALKILKVELKSHGNQKVTWALKFYTALNGGVEEVIENVWKELSKFR